MTAIGWYRRILRGHGELTFRLKPFSFKHTGLFPEQAVNWDWFSGIIRSSKRPLKVLNLFAYTGGATLSAAKAGANVTHEMCIRDRYMGYMS